MIYDVTQEDREAAKSLLGRDDAGPSWWSIDSGNADSDPLVQAFAAYRTAARNEGIEAAVRYIQDQYPHDKRVLVPAIRKLKGVTGMELLGHEFAAIWDANVDTLYEEPTDAAE